MPNQQWGLWHWCPVCLPAKRWRGRWETHAAYRENVRGSRNTPPPPGPAHLLGTSESPSRSLDGEGRESNYIKGKRKASVKVRKDSWNLYKVDGAHSLLKKTCLPFSPWWLPAQVQHRSRTLELYCQHGCFPESTSVPVCHTADGCITWKRTHRCNQTDI